MIDREDVRDFFEGAGLSLLAGIAALAMIAGVILMAKGIMTDPPPACVCPDVVWRP